MLFHVKQEGFKEHTVCLYESLRIVTKRRLYLTTLDESVLNICSFIHRKTEPKNENDNR